MSERDRSSLSMAVINEIAKHEGVDSVNLSEPLAETINPDALDALFTGGSGKVQFEYLEYHIEITHDGSIAVQPLVGESF